MYRIKINSVPLVLSTMTEAFSTKAWTKINFHHHVPPSTSFNFVEQLVKSKIRKQICKVKECKYCHIN
ncbi:CLUMA_CG021640, isoform A [Clunio marinus]|uniref:CLUMA_CG021640, isoform A n=1 Tax=Clunio marinus TaxID=568069 RepID=A0A1J1J9C6_9DIPT|nr:CLUMA_CG021640, isoform A [Clunio marinus]